MKNLQEYVVAFIFDQKDSVWMIEKQKPEWQKGCYNGIGGKIEEYENADTAMYRELEEEAGVNGISLIQVGVMDGLNNDGSDFRVFIYTGFTDQILVSQEQEQICLVQIELIKDLPHIENVPALIELCLYKLNGKSNFKKFQLFY